MDPGTHGVEILGFKIQMPSKSHDQMEITFGVGTFMYLHVAWRGASQDIMQLMLADIYIYINPMQSLIMGASCFATKKVAKFTVLRNYLGLEGN